MFTVYLEKHIVLELCWLMFCSWVRFGNGDNTSGNIE